MEDFNDLKVEQEVIVEQVWHPSHKQLQQPKKPSLTRAVKISLIKSEEKSESKLPRLKEVTDLKLVSDSYSRFRIQIRSFVFGSRIRNWKI